MLTIYNTLTRQKAPFVPLEPNRIRLYVCGLTVYDYFHVGNARTMIAFDTIVRYLRFRGYTVDYVRNITDIDDKILRRAAERGIAYDAITREFIDALHTDGAKLNLLTPDIEPRATAYIDQMIALISTLVEKGLAYQAASGDVCYSVSQFPGYGKLSGKNIADLRAGERVAIACDKQDPLDFVLWKMAKPAEPAWPSPWGDGRPGWHIECSAMASDCLGETIDIHGGGFDLQFPHHENEIAQSEGATGKPFARHWMHVGFLKIDNEKMAKSLGNFFTARDVMQHYHPEVLRFLMATSHYRQPLNYSEKMMEQSRTGLQRLYLAIRGFDLDNAPQNTNFKEAFHAAMDDDFNTPEALAVLFDMARTINTHRKENRIAEAANIAASLRTYAQLLGFLHTEPDDYLQATDRDIADIEAKIAERTAARAQKDFARADAIRAELLADNIVLEDSSEGTIWRVV